MLNYRGIGETVSSWEALLVIGLVIFGVWIIASERRADQRLKETYRKAFTIAELKELAINGSPNAQRTLDDLGEEWDNGADHRHGSW